MGKQIIQQRRGKGSRTYRVPTYKFRPKFEFKHLEGKTVDIVHYVLTDAILAKIEYQDGSIGYLPAPLGLSVGQSISKFVVRLSSLEEGSVISCMETYPNSGPKLCRSPGSAGIVLSKAKYITVQLPSRKTINLHPSCMAILGTPAGEGREERPFIKAGNKHYLMRRRGKLYPRTSAKKMNAVDHPFGGSGHGKERSPSSHRSPPGRKVGHISPRRTGRRK